MDDLQRVLIERECSRLVVLFCVLVDAYRHEELTELWAADALWETWRGPLRGQQEIRAYLDAKEQTDTGIHIVQNVLIDVEDGRNARGSAVFTYHGGGGGEAAPLTPRVIGRYDDRFVLTERGWRFARRSTEIVFTGS